MSILHPTKDSFKKEVLDSKVPVLVDFWAEWCPPCRAIAPVLEELAALADGKFQVAKVNVDNDREIAMEFGVRNIPTLVLIRDGKEVDRKVGLQNIDQLKELMGI